MAEDFPFSGMHPCFGRGSTFWWGLPSKNANPRFKISIKLKGATEANKAHTARKSTLMKEQRENGKADWE